MKKYMSPEAQLLEFSATEDICATSYVESKDDVVVVDYDDGVDTLDD